jgi:hypothetical protein
MVLSSFGLLPPLHVPDDLANDVFGVYDTKLPTVHAAVVNPDDLDPMAVCCEMVDDFDHRAVQWMSEGDDVSGLGGGKKVGDFGHKYKIPILVGRSQAIA